MIPRGCCTVPPTRSARLNRASASFGSVNTGACAGFVLAAAASVALLAARRLSRHSRISFGPFLLGGALLATLAAALSHR